jgi:hypothetical protein
MDKLIEALKAAGEDKDKQAAAIQANAGGLYQHIFQSGHDVGYGKKGAELTAAQGKVTALEGEVVTLKTEVTTLKSAPDTKALHDQYGREIQTVKDKATARETELLGNLRTERHGQAKAKLRTALGKGEKRLVEAFADVLVEKADVIARIKIGDDGTRQVLQAGKDIPFAATDFDAQLGMLAEELKGSAPADFVLVGTDAGGGTGAKGAPHTPPSTFDKIREDVKKQAAAGTAQEGIKPHGAFAGLALVQ